MAGAVGRRPESEAAAAGAASGTGAAAATGFAAARGAFVVPLGRARVTFGFGGGASAPVGSFGSSLAVGSVMSLAYRARRSTATRPFTPRRRTSGILREAAGRSDHPVESDAPRGPDRGRQR